MSRKQRIYRNGKSFFSSTVCLKQMLVGELSRGLILPGPAKHVAITNEYTNWKHVARDLPRVARKTAHGLI